MFDSPPKRKSEPTLALGLLEELKRLKLSRPYIFTTCSDADDEIEQDRSSSDAGLKSGHGSRLELMKESSVSKLKESLNQRFKSYCPKRIREDLSKKCQPCKQELKDQNPASEEKTGLTTEDPAIAEGSSSSAKIQDSMEVNDG